MDLPERVASKIDTGDGSGCWLWTASTNTTGYGQIGYRLDGRTHWLAHRLVWRLLVGELPAHLHHECHTPRCVRPDHLRPLASNAEHRAIHAADRTTCSAGHEFTPENSYVRADGGGRQCRICKAERQRARHAGRALQENIARTERRRRARAV